MLTYQHTAFTVFDTYEILYVGHETDASVGSGRRRRFLDWCGFRFSTTLWNVFVIELRVSFVFFGGTDVCYVCKNWVCLGYFRLEVQSVRFVSFSVLFSALHIPYTHARLPPYCLHCPWEIWYIVLRTQKRRRHRFRAWASYPMANKVSFRDGKAAGTWSWPLTSM
jgi:hypothetical protein